MYGPTSEDRKTTPSSLGRRAAGNWPPLILHHCLLSSEGTGHLCFSVASLAEAGRWRLHVLFLGILRVEGTFAESRPAVRIPLQRSWLFPLSEQLEGRDSDTVELQHGRIQVPGLGVNKTP